ncbi:MAG: class I SAM-dependent methyltransferase, partial [Proteobacteria bacterium]
MRDYLVQHVKGIRRIVPDQEIPKAYRRDYLAAQAELADEHIEEDLEAERVTALYLMNHYLRVGDANGEWWKAQHSLGSEVFDHLIQKHWNHGPLDQISAWIHSLATDSSIQSCIELGCGVGGLAHRIQDVSGIYLGMDSSFASIALARHLSLGMEYPTTIKIPEDLMAGGVSREIKTPKPKSPSGKIDFIVGDIENLPLVPEDYDVSVALNAIDMLDEPARLPELQAQLVRPGGYVLQSCPYIWSETVAKN